MNAGWHLEGKPGYCISDGFGLMSPLAFPEGESSVGVTSVNTGLSLPRSNQGRKKSLNIKMLTLTLLYSAGNTTQYSVMACMGKESKKSGDMCVCIRIYIYRVNTVVITCNHLPGDTVVKNLPATQEMWV